jgi:enoyl-CoA hydratase/carnithine racemase
MDFQLIKLEALGPIGEITLNNPGKRNALSLKMLEELCEAVDYLRANEQIKVVIVKGEGKAFSSGHDLNELLDKEKADYDKIFRTCSDFMQGIQGLSQPFIAQVHGIATAAGCQLVAACDLAIAETGAMFGTPGVKLGLFCTTPAIPLVRAIGRKRALEMLLTGRLISAKEALEFGLVNKVVPIEQLEAMTQAMAQEIAASSLLTLGIGKRTFYAQVGLADAQAYNLGCEVMVSNLFAEDAKEGIRAFLEKRRPVWKGR